MEEKIPAGTIMYIEENSPLSNRDIGLFNYNNSLIVRRFIIRKHDVVLRADNDKIEDIVLDNDDNYFIVGKILGINNPKENKFIVF
jgi:SOS-response transcriptional repressor LexA